LMGAVFVPPVLSSSGKLTSFWQLMAKKEMVRTRTGYNSLFINFICINILVCEKKGWVKEKRDGNKLS
jgi:hypothetical protein